MNAAPNLASIASLIGDRARAEMLGALMSGKALTATELAAVANITKQTASAHLAKLLERKLLALEAQGRHRYFRLADADVAHMLESLMDVAQRSGIVKLQTGPSDAALRRARVCYDHFAGDVGVQLLAGMQRKNFLRVVGEGAELTARGEKLCAELSIDLKALAQSRRPLCRLCLDWSERRHHLAGALGAALLATFFTRGWARRKRDSRIVIVGTAGATILRDRFGVRSSGGYDVGQS
jgi:DNA-binding transcriptional ArsR family regulator